MHTTRNQASRSHKRAARKGGRGSTLPQKPSEGKTEHRIEPGDQAYARALAGLRQLPPPTLASLAEQVAQLGEHLDGQDFRQEVFEKRMAAAYRNLLAHINNQNAEHLYETVKKNAPAPRLPDSSSAVDSLPPASHESLSIREVDFCTSLFYVGSLMCNLSHDLYAGRLQYASDAVLFALWEEVVNRIQLLPSLDTGSWAALLERA